MKQNILIEELQLLMKQRILMVIIIEKLKEKEIYLNNKNNDLPFSACA